MRASERESCDGMRIRKQAEVEENGDGFRVEVGGAQGQQTLGRPGVRDGVTRNLHFMMRKHLEAE